MFRTEIRDLLYRRMPLFFIGLASVAGIYSYLSSSYHISFLLFGAICICVLRFKHILLLGAVALISFLFAQSSITLLPLDSSVSGEAVCYLTESVPCVFHKKPMVRCEVWINSFTDRSGSEVARGVRAVLYQKRPSLLKGGELYRMHGVLKRAHDFCFQLRPQGPIESIDTHQFSFVEERGQVREFLIKKLHEIFHDDEAIQLIGTMCFSLPCNQEVRRTIHKVGLDHVLGVSGIHFTQLACLVTLAAGFCRRWIYSCVTWTSLTLFFLFVGPLPAVFRAWVSSTLCIGQRVCGREAYGLNSLGVGLLCLIVFDPMTLTTLSLQLSFIATGAILAWYRPVRQFLERLLPSFSKIELFNFSWSDQALSCILKCVKTTLSVVLSISIVMIPYQLAFMPDLPLMGLLANLFLPIFFDIALIVTFFVLLIYSLIPFLGAILGFIMEKYIQILINVVREMPSPLWSMVQGIRIHEEMAVFTVGLCILGGAMYSVYMEYSQNTRTEAWMSVI